MSATPTSPTPPAALAAAWQRFDAAWEQCRTANGSILIYAAALDGRDAAGGAAMTPYIDSTPLPGEIIAMALYRAGLWLIGAGFRVVRRTGWNVALCAQCGMLPRVDEDGACATCGGDALHSWHLPAKGDDHV